MYISTNWLKDFVKIPAKIKAEEIAEKLTNHTVEVEGVLNQEEIFKNVVVGEVLEVNPHPNADRLRATVVDVKKEKLNIVCGAPNVEAGQMVVVALIGAILPNGLEITEAEIRGEKSFGMICAEDELGLGKDHDGIMVLDKGAKAGQEFAKYLKSDDIVLEVDNKSLSNRPDLLSHYGIAREISAIFDLNLKDYDSLFDGKLKFLDEKENTLEVKVEDKELCPRYMAVKINGIEIKESPEWLKERLVAVNQSPINNIVDLTNFVMLESGQPLHAFDAPKVDQVIVRKANKNETVTTLDDKERNLNDTDLVIADSKKAIAIAGVMGGSNSEVDNDTTEIILESANFKATAIRKTSQKLGLRTEASTRFEKSLDTRSTELAIKRFLSLLKEMCPKCEITSALIDIDNSPAQPEAIELDLKWLEIKIGEAIPQKTVVNYLTKLGFILGDKEEGKLAVTIPSWRATKDVATKEDLAEEVLRLYGYDNIPSQMPEITMTLPEVNESRRWERKIKNILALSYSLNESYNYSFVGEDYLKKLSIDFSDYLRLANPLSDIHSLLRQSLAPNLINNVKNNQAKAEELGFFEIGRVYFDAPGALKKDDDKEDTLPHQEDHLGIVLAGSDRDVFVKLKSVVNSLFQGIVRHDTETEFTSLETVPAWADGDNSAKIVVNDTELGVITLVSKKTAANLNLKKEVAVVEISFSNLIEFLRQQKEFRFKEAPKYPPMVRDIAFVVEQGILYNDLKREISSFNPLIKTVELFDVYEGNKLEGNKKSLAFHLSFQSEEKTLTTEEVDKIQNELTEHMFNKFEAKLRDF